MPEPESLLKEMRILAVDDEQDVLETIEDILSDALVDGARDYAAASEKIKKNRYDLAILDIMGVDGLTLLEEAVAKNIPSIMLTAHAVNPETLMASIRKGAISYLPKETLADLDRLIEELFAAYRRGDPPWKLLFDKLGGYFDERFGQGWQDKQSEFWNKFNRTYQVGKGIQQRLLQDEDLRRKGI